MSLFKRADSKTYWMSLSLPGGKRVQVSTGSTNKKLAEKIHAKHVLDIAEGRYFDIEHRTRSLVDMIEKYKSDYTDGRTYYCKARDLSLFKNLLRFFLRGWSYRKMLIIGSSRWSWLPYIPACA